MLANVVTLESNMESLYVQYIRERENASVIEHAHGFAVYKMQPDHCYLQDIYVLPEHRKSGLGVQLMNDVIERAKILGHTKLVGSVVPSTSFGNTMLQIMQGLGFNLLSSSDDIIYLVKEI